MNIEDYRKTIDELDAQLLPLLIERMKASAAIGKLKRDQGLPVFDATREQQIIKRLTQNVPQEYAPFIAQLYQGIFAASKSLQETLQ